MRGEVDPQREEVTLCVCMCVSVCVTDLHTEPTAHIQIQSASMSQGTVRCAPAERTEWVGKLHFDFESPDVQRYQTEQRGPEEDVQERLWVNVPG